MLHRRETAEELPVRILDLTRDGRFVRFVERVLQILQTDHQSYRLTYRFSVDSKEFESDVIAFHSLSGQCDH